MRLFLVISSLCLFLLSCGGEKKVVGDAEPVAEPVDSMMTDSTEMMADEEVSDEYSHADEYFSDFIYSFTENERFQRSRVVFPLTINKDSVKTGMDRKSWKFLPLGNESDVYTIVYGDRKAMDIEKEVSLDSVTMCHLNFQEHTLINYIFKRQDRRWMLSEIVQSETDDFRDYEFMAFFQQFASDSLFQYNHVNTMVQFVMTEMEEGVGDMSGTLEKSQWTVFRPEMPQDDFFIIDYGQSLQDNQHRLLTLQGRSNGYVILLFFRKTHEGWMLYRYEY